MAPIYDKALKQKDFSSAVMASMSAKALGGIQKISIKKAVLEQVGKGKNKSVYCFPIINSPLHWWYLGGKASAAADIGKFVNMMSADVSKVSQIFGNLYNLYGAPFEIIITSIYLYQCIHGSIQINHLILITGPLGFLGTLHSLASLHLCSSLLSITNSQHDKSSFSGYFHHLGLTYGCSQWAVCVCQVHKVMHMGQMVDQSGGTRKGEGTQVDWKGDDARTNKK